jgi:hypothetical protein
MMTRKVGRRRPLRWTATLALLAVVAAAGSGCAATGPGPGKGAVVRAQTRAAAADRLLPVAVEDSLLASEQSLPTAARVGLWARRFQAAEGVRYVFGPAADGYVAERELVRDHRQDCISLLYRCSELARARDHNDAIASRWRRALPALRPKRSSTPRVVSTTSTPRISTSAST